MKITLTSCYKDRDPVSIDLENPPKDLEMIVQTYFGDYTSGTNEDYVDDDKLAYIDLLRDKIHPEQHDGYEAVKQSILYSCEWQLTEEGELPSVDDFWDLGWIGKMYEQGDKKLYDKQYGWKGMDHHSYDRIHHTLVRMIKAVMSYDDKERDYRGGKQYLDFSKRANELITKSGMTYRELAKKIGSTEVTVTRFMTGARIPNAWTCHLIADALGTTTDYLICGRKEDGGAS